MTFRLVPQEVREAVKEIANQLGCTADLLAETLLQYGGHCYQRGELRLQPQPTPRGLRLYPEHYQSSSKPKKLRWTENQQQPLPPHPKRKPRQRPAGLYRQQVTYRLSPEIREEMARLLTVSSSSPGRSGHTLLAMGDPGLPIREAGPKKELKNETLHRPLAEKQIVFSDCQTAACHPAGILPSNLFVLGGFTRSLMRGWLAEFVC